jgi:hypothetical protein
MTRKQKTLWDLFVAGASLDSIWMLAKYKTRDEAMTDLRQMRFDHWRRTGEKINRG